MKFTIESFTDSNWKAVASLFEKNTPRFFAPEEIDDLRAYLKTHSETYFTLKMNTEVVGCGGYCMSSENIGRITWDLIDPDYHGMGLGSMLVEHCLEEMANNTEYGLDKVEVFTSQYANRFYGRFGFELQRIEEDYWAKGLHLYYMQLTK